MRCLFVFVLLLCACEHPSGSHEHGITRSCVRSFAPTLAAWESELGRVPQECAYLDSEYDVQLTSAEDIPCEPEASTELVVGCTVAGDAIYLLAGRDDVQLYDTSVHEWVHALARCVDGDADRYHLRSELWAQYGAEAVEFRGQTPDFEIGECL